MQIQTLHTSYYSPTKDNQPIQTQNLLDLMRHVGGREEEDEKKNKSKIEVRYENGYLRQYLVKPTGQRVLLMETKQSLDMRKSTNLQDLLSQPFKKKTSDPILSILNAKNNISKYKDGI
ncbi:hypothetical protein [Lysinibacillus capsici]|uniref:hypothetical protein n=1 Tax=Lysinibacillus capsici TaxID=2115968 RepID=UPI002DB6395F|nr:hypothetical protein [Lysinibacillus capsici]MEC1302193.1 hypothetical protein [Lysinibacillus capsici]